MAKDAEAAGIKPTNSSDKSKNDKVASETVEDLKAENKKDSKENKGIGETLCDIGGDILEGVAEWFQSEEVQEVLKTIGIAAVAALMAVLIGPYIAAGLISIFGLTATTAVTAMTITSYVFTAGATYGTLDSASEGEPFLESLREGIETGATWTIIALVLYASYLLVLELIALVGKITPESIADALDGVYQTIQEWFNEGDNDTSWYNPDGSINYPPNNGAVPGTEEVIALQPGDILGRYGEIRDASNYVTQPGVDPSSLSLPPTTDPSIYQEFEVVKENPDTIQSEIAAWGDSEGGGLQYELPMPIKELIEKGYIVPR